MIAPKTLRIAGFLPNFDSFIPIYSNSTQYIFSNLSRNSLVKVFMNFPKILNFKVASGKWGKMSSKCTYVNKPLTNRGENWHGCSGAKIPVN